MITESEIIDSKTEIDILHKEGNELLSIFGASVKKVKSRLNNNTQS